MAPRRTSCQPDGVLSEIDERIARGELAPSERGRARASEETRVAPRFDSIHFGDAAYARLADDAAPELTRGAHDVGELGGYHELWQRLREQDLARRLDEYAPAGIDIDTLYAT